MKGKEIYLSEEQQEQLRDIVKKGVHNSHVITRARVLLMLDRTGKSDHVLVMDNLNTHAVASLYKAFPPEEAFRLSQRLEIHYTPKHGSWLDIAEIELSSLTIQSLLGDRIPSIDALNNIWTYVNTLDKKSRKIILLFLVPPPFAEV